MKTQSGRGQNGFREESSSVSVTVSAGNVGSLATVTYTRGVDLSGSLQGAGGIGGLLARTDMGRLTVNDPLASAYYHADGNGNIAALITGLRDTNQVLVAKYLYDPYGNLLAESGPLAGANKYRFSSKEWDSPAGLYYYLYRFYDPNLQRWLNRDPFGEPGLGILIEREVGDLFTEIGGEDLFWFVGNEPISRLDLYGLCDFCNISIACHPVLAVLGLGSHCSVIGPDGTYYEGEPYNGLGDPIVPVIGGPHHGDVRYPVSCPGESCDDVKQKLDNYFENGSTPPYNLFGPNSDTYAHNMLNAAGCSVNPIPTTIQRSPRQGGANQRSDDDAAAWDGWMVIIRWLMKRDYELAAMSVFACLSLCAGCMYPDWTKRPWQSLVWQRIPVMVQQGKPVNVEIRVRTEGNTLSIRCSPEVWHALVNSTNTTTIQIETSKGAAVYSVKPGWLVRRPASEGGELRPAGTAFLIPNAQYLCWIYAKHRGKATVRIVFPNGPKEPAPAEIIVEKAPPDGP